MSRIVAVLALALAMAPAMLAVAPRAAPAADEHKWVERQLDVDVRLSGEIEKDCDPTEDTEVVAVPHPARNVKVTSPDEGQIFAGRSRDRVGGQITKADAESAGADPYSWRIVVEARGPRCDGSAITLLEEIEWETGDVDVEATYEHLEFVDDPLNGPCADRYATIFELRTLNTSCLYANDLVLRYFGTLRIRGTHRLGLWTCYDRAASDRGRVVACRGPAGRAVSFIFRRSGAAAPGLIALGGLGRLGS